MIGASTSSGRSATPHANLINGGYQGEIYPIHPEGGEILGYEAYRASRRARRDRHHVFAIPAKFMASALVECGEKQIPGAVRSLGLCRSGCASN